MEPGPYQAPLLESNVISIVPLILTAVHTAVQTFFKYKMAPRILYILRKEVGELEKWVSSVLILFFLE